MERKLLTVKQTKEEVGDGEVGMAEVIIASLEQGIWEGESKQLNDWNCSSIKTTKILWQVSHDFFVLFLHSVLMGLKEDFLGSKR